MTYSYYSSNADASAYFESLVDCDVIALDTEFIRTRTFYPIPALYQFNCQGDIALLDATDKGDWSAFVQVLQSNEQVKVMHACGEDLEVFLRHFQLVPENIFDTQIAYALLTEVFSISYAKLVSAVFEVDLDKHETRSNWLQRPLSNQQLEYAVDDVHYLPALHEYLQDKLKSLGRMEWFAEEMQRYLRPNAVTPETYYRTVKRSGGLSAEDMSKLRFMCQWREIKARTSDVPRGRVVKDEQLVGLASLPQFDEQQFVKILTMPAYKKHGQDLRTAFEAGLSLPASEHPEPQDMPFKPLENETVKKLKQYASAKALELNMAPEMLGRKRDLEATVRVFMKTGGLAEVHSGWRMDIVGNEFLRIMKGAGLETAS
ncbi:MAG: HRDC domain-containing protein [Pseudomonadales bacterium]|nr:HRDC domain-containing protein [Pseudomonadales bacterium]